MPGFCKPSRHRNVCHELVDANPTGSVVGYYDGTPIAEEVVDEFGRRFGYVGAAPRNSKGTYDAGLLQPGEFIVGRGLLYRLKGVKEKSPKDRKREIRLPARMRRLRKEGRRVAIEMARWLFG
jgi:hypothetical protein